MKIHVLLFIVCLSVFFISCESAEAKKKKPQPIRAQPSVGRNEPCPCGSGKKYKKCCGLEKKID